VSRANVNTSMNRLHGDPVARRTIVRFGRAVLMGANRAPHCPHPQVQTQIGQSMPSSRSVVSMTGRMWWVIMLHHSSLQTVQ